MNSIQSCFIRFVERNTNLKQIYNGKLISNLRMYMQSVIKRDDCTLFLEMVKFERHRATRANDILVPSVLDCIFEKCNMQKNLNNTCPHTPLCTNQYSTR
ncbi:hypothetical protein Tsp_03076 [Trichinella spiralis]|uniref:hypothetical protein n=1 Tax=Trichinella spiralis TaxID=6334 RepID=UPI0001EFB7F7|nr:hypothetical protein Tsp_03076 [Trichinella spiralis]